MRSSDTRTGVTPIRQRHELRMPQPYEQDPIFRDALADVRSLRSSERHRGAQRRTWLWLIDVTLVFAVAFSAFVGYGLANNRWYRIVAVQGASMNPTLRSGDAIVLTRPPAQLEAGMIVTLEVDGNVVTHRVVEVHDDGGFRTKGDANSVLDDWGGLDVEVVGIQRARVPFLGRLLTELTRITGSNAWQTDRATIGTSIAGAECLGACVSEDASSAPGGDVEGQSTGGDVEGQSTGGESATGDVYHEDQASRNDVADRDQGPGVSADDDINSGHADSVPPPVGEPNN